jgi:hypothetical protein
MFFKKDELAEWKKKNRIVHVQSIEEAFVLWASNEPQPTPVREEMMAWLRRAKRLVR